MSSGKSGFYALKKGLIEENSLFVDQEFPPDLKSILPTGTWKGNLNIQQVEWKRPVDLSKEPKFVSNGTTRSDLHQGDLGDCWFVAAASLLVNGPRQQFERVVPPDQDFEEMNYAGIFRFNFWWYGQWKEVIIDDYLPTNGRRLLFCSNYEDKDEFWGALLEKAYAKLRGSYVALDGGKLADALVDMTGGLSETYALTNRSEVPPNLYDILWKFSQMNSLVGGSIYLPADERSVVERSNGLILGHAYSITALSIVPYHGSSVKLLRLRNPWGKGEWRGPWSDKSPEIQSLPMDVKEKLNIIKKIDGEFWISFDDFMENFDEIQLCHLEPDAVAQQPAGHTQKLNWSVAMYHGAWIKGVTAGGCGNSPYEKLFWKNPQFRVHLKDIDTTDNRNMCSMVVSLMEKEKGGTSANIAVAFDVYQIRNSLRRPLDDTTLSKAQLIRKRSAGKYQFYREVTKRFEFEPGYYVIIPSTFYPHEEAEFLLRIFTEKEVDSEVLEEVNKPETPVSVPKDDIFPLFTKYAGEDGKLDYRELRQFLLEATTKELKKPVSLSPEACRSLVTMLDKNTSGFLDWEEAKVLLQEIRAYMSVFRQFGDDRSNSIDMMELGTLFNKLGFTVSRGVLTSIMRRYGGQNRKISLDDFITVMCKLVVMFGFFQEQHRKTGGPDDVAQFTRNEFLQYTMFC